MESYTLYVHTCPNNKRYVGITRQKVKDRWGANGKGYEEHNKHFYSAIQKYGWENIKHEVMLTDLTKEEAEFWEVYYIDLYNTTNREHGYNKAKGGLVNSKWKMPPSFYDAHGKKVDKYDLNGKLVETYHSLSEAARSVNIINGSQITLCCNGKLRMSKGFIFRWHGEPFDKYYTGKVSNDKREVEQLDLKGNVIAIYESVAEAERKTGIPNTNICKVCIGKTGRKKAGGYIWRYKGEVV